MEFKNYFTQNIDKFTQSVYDYNVKIIFNTFSISFFV